MRVAPPVNLSEEQREELGTLSRGRRTAVRVVERARIILLCAEGTQNREIAELLGATLRTVGLWRRHFVQNVALEAEAEVVEITYQEAVLAQGQEALPAPFAPLIPEGSVVQGDRARAIGAGEGLKLGGSEVGGRRRKHFQQRIGWFLFPHRETWIEIMAIADGSPFIQDRSPATEDRSQAFQDRSPSIQDRSPSF
jgi:hypothetical protein